ncbi:MAG: phospholipase [Nitrospina sp.]|jgi:predicted esterase|nr:phospholipase [Nitrospina sp.]
MKIQYQNTLWNNKKVIIGEPDLDLSKPVNLLIGFHGAGSTAENMLVQGNRLKLDNTLLIFPEGPVDAGEGLWSWWKDGPGQPKSVEAFLTFTDEMIQSAQNHFTHSSIHQVSLWGFSQGGAASLVYALLGSNKVFKIASVCGFLPELPPSASVSQSPKQILGIFGANDEVVPSFLADYALEEMKNKGHEVKIKETSQSHELNAENLAEICSFFKE